jgi:hypothetical protein
MTPFPVFSFSIQDLHITQACDIPRRVSDLTTHLGRKPSEHEQISARVWWALPSTEFFDRIWSLRLDSVSAPQVAVRLSLFAARQVLPIVEAKYPRDTFPHPHAMIEALSAWIANPTKDRFSEVSRLRLLLGKKEYPIGSDYDTASAIYIASFIADKVHNKKDVNVTITHLSGATKTAANTVQYAAIRGLSLNAKTKQLMVDKVDAETIATLSAYLDSLYSEA